MNRAGLASDTAAHTALDREAAEKRYRMRRFKQNIPLLILFVPIIVYFAIFKYAPMFGLIIVFKNYNFFDGLWGSPWVGLDNFRMLFMNPQSTQIIRNTFVLSVLSVFVGFPFPIIMAILLNEVRKMWVKRSVQTLVYLPHFLSWVIVGGFVATIFAQQTGVINRLISILGGEGIPFLYKEGSWTAIFVGAGIWKEIGYSAIIYLASLSAIDPHLYESAAMDGANKFKQMWHITLPGISGIIVLMLVLSMGNVMEMGFDRVYVLQNSVVSNISEVISTYTYKVGLLQGRFSFTAAMGFFENMIGLILVLTANYIARRFDRGLW